MSSSNGGETSWGDTIRAYDASRRSLPWKAEDVVPVQKVGLLERRTMEREVDPVLMKFRDEAKEENFQRTISSRKSTKVNKMAGQKFNIITHKGNEAPKFPEKKHRGIRDYNIMSHYPSRFHKTAPTKFDEGYYLACSRPVKVETGLSNDRGREFNILSNKYKTNNDERQLEDHERIQERMREIYWRTHTYDPIRVEMYDEEKEKKAKKAEEEKIQNKQRSKMEKMPPRFKQAEGNTYNIVSHKITNPERFGALQEQSLHRYRGREEILKNTLQRSQEKQDLEEQRKLNRVSFARYASAAEGYDFVFPEAHSTAKPLPKHPGSVWDRLQSDQSSGGGYNGGGGAVSRRGSRPRDLSGEASLSPSLSSPVLMTSSRPASDTFAFSGRSGPNSSSARNCATAAASTRGSSRAVPSLDISRAEYGTPVTYSEPSGIVGAGTLVPIVRTGGIGSMALSP